MKPEQINKAIAKACGWTHLDTFDINFRDKWWSGREIGVPPEQKGKPIKDSVRVIPNYFGDLNAIHEAWKSIDPVSATTALYWIVTTPEERHTDHFITFTIMEKLTNATAPQRCEAFLRTRGEWIENFPERANSVSEMGQHPVKS